MKNNPEISIILPAYNGMPYIKECVESVLNQGFINWELLISDDCSSDDTLEYLNSILDERVKVFSQKKNLGIFGNLNFLFSKANAPVSQILCGDDYFISNDSVEIIVNSWKNLKPSIGFIRFNQNTQAQCRLTQCFIDCNPGIIEPTSSDIWFYIFGNISGNLSNVTLRNSIFSNCGPFREDLPYAGDFEFWSRVAQKFSFIIIGKEVTFIRRHPDAASFHLNKKGELISQASGIYKDLYDSIVINHPNISQNLLKIHGTLNFYSPVFYDSLRRPPSVRNFFLKALEDSMKNSNFILGSLNRNLLFLFSLGGRIGRVFSAKFLMRKINIVNYLNHDESE